MALVDAALGEFAGSAKILKFGAARLAIRIVAWTANGRNNEIAGFQAAHIRADFFNDAERFVADDQILETGRRRAVNERAYLLVSATDADLQGTDFYFVIVGEFRGNVLHETHFFAPLENTDSSHRLVHRTVVKWL
jgi:hypothetical protein